MGKFVTRFVVFAIIFSLFAGLAYADEVVHIEEGQPAPFDGTLYDLAAGIKLFKDLKDAQIAKESCKIELDSQLKLLQNDWQLKYDLLQNKMNGATERLEMKNQTYEEVIQMQSTTIERLQKKPFYKDPVLIFAGGTLVGISLTLLSAWAVGQASG